MKFHHRNAITLSLLISLVFISSVFSGMGAFTPEQQAEVGSLNSENTFMQSINGFTYEIGYKSEEEIQIAKNILSELDFSEENDIIDGFGTGLTAPTERELEIMERTKFIQTPVPSTSKKSPGATYDMSTSPYFPEVRSQQSQGSCGAWASTYYAFGFTEAKDYGWNTASAGNDSQLMQPAWTFNKVSTTNGGSWMTTNYEIIKNFGCPTWTTMDYDDSDYWSWGNETAWREAPYHRVNDYYLIDFDESTPSLTIDTIKSLVSSDTPVTFAFHADEYIPGFADGNYILSSVEYDNSELNHAQCIVGYDDSITDDGDVGAFRVVNSWGSSWGDSGFYWMTYDCLIEIGMNLGDFGVHLCVVTDKVDYEPELIATWEFSTAPTRMEDMITLSVGPHETPYDSIMPWYEYDDTYALPEFMTLDISDFYSYYSLDNDEIFYLDIGSSFTTGTMISFLIERYSSGNLVETTAESIHVPLTTPGYALNTFMTIDHETEVSIETPLYPKIGETYQINASVENLGIYTESGVILYIYLDDGIVTSTSMPPMGVGTSQSTSYMWTPSTYGTFNFTAYSAPVTGENVITNNQMENLVSVDKWENYTMTTDHPYSWLDASDGTELILEDDDYVQITLPFDFTFYNHSFSKVYLSTNGYLSFYDDTPDEWENAPFPSDLSMHSYMIAPFWEDIYPQFHGHIYVKSYNNCWVGQWENVPYTYPGLEKCSFQVILYKTGDIVFNYDYFQAPFTATCGLNLGLNDTYYNSYDGLTEYTDDFSIFFTGSPYPGGFNIFSNANSPDIDGNFDLTWGESVDSNNYTVYQYSGLITEINGSLTKIADEITDLSLNIYGYTDGTYYFIVVASNNDGSTLSNCKKVIVTIPSPSSPGEFTLTTDADDPDTDGAFYLNWTNSLDANNYSVFSHTSMITEINSSIIWMVNETTNNYVHTSGYSDGTYYFLVIAENDYGEQWSNIITVIVDVPDDKIPGYSIQLVLISVIGIAVLILKTVKTTRLE